MDDDIGGGELESAHHRNAESRRECVATLFIHHGQGRGQCIGNGPLCPDHCDLSRADQPLSGVRINHVRPPGAVRVLNALKLGSRRCDSEVLHGDH